MINTRNRKSGKYRNAPVPKSVITPADRRPWVKPLGLVDALEAVGMAVLAHFYGGDVERMSTRAGLKTIPVFVFCENYWMKHYPQAFQLYFVMKHRDLTGEDIVDRLYNQWYKRLKNGWKQTGIHSGEHKSIKWR